MSKWFERKPDGSLDITDSFGRWSVGTFFVCILTLNPLFAIPFAVMSAWKFLCIVFHGMGVAMKATSKTASKLNRPVKVVQVPTQIAQPVKPDLIEQMNALLRKVDSMPCLPEERETYKEAIRTRFERLLKERYN